MSKKMMRRSLALGALMAFVITGQAWAESVINQSHLVYNEDTTIEASYSSQNITSDIEDPDVRVAAIGYTTGTDNKITIADGKTLTVKNELIDTKRNYGIGIVGDASLTVDGNVKVDVNATQDGVQARAIRNTGSGTLKIDGDVIVTAKAKKDAAVGVNAWNENGESKTIINGNAIVTVEIEDANSTYWANAAQAGGKGGVIEFNGADKTDLTAKSTGYTAQTVQVSSSIDKMYFNSALTNITSVSNVGANGVGGSGTAYFQGEDGIVNINVLVDNNNDGVGDGGTSNAIGVISSLVVSDAVKEFNIDVKGSGIDSKNPGESNGTAAIFAVGDQVEVNAQKFTANVVAGVGEDRVVNNTYGIRASVGGEVNINSSIIDIGVTDDLGSAYGVRANCNDLTNGTTTYDDAGTINLGGDNSVITIDATANKGFAVGIAAHRSNDSNKNNASSVTVNGKSLVINAKGETAYGVLGMNNTTGTATNVSTVTINSADTTINAKAGLVALSQSKINVNGNLTVNSEGGDAIVSRGGATVNINAEGKDRVVKLTGDIDFNYDEATSGTPIDATVNLNLTNADSFFTGKIYKSGNPNLPADKSALSGMNISLSNGAKWNLTDASVVSNATFGKDSVLILKEGSAFEAKETGNVYALNASDGETSLTVAQGAKLQIGGIKETTYNIATGFASYEVAETLDIADNALLQANKILKDKNYQVAITAKKADQMAADTGISTSTAELVQSIIEGADNEDKTPAQEAAVEFIENVIANNPTDAAVGNAINAATKMGEAGGNSATAASIVKNVTGVTNDRLSFNCGHSAPHKGGHGVGLFEEGSGADIWVEYVHGKDKVEDMPSTAGASSYEGQYNGIVMGVDFKKVGKFQSGIAFNYGEGDTNSVGSSVHTHSDYDFWGVGYYGNIHNEDSNVIFDINYAQTDSDVTQNNSTTVFEARPETTTWSAGVKLEKLYQNENVQIVPYTGLRYMSIDADDYSTRNGEFYYSMDRQDIWLLPLGVSIRQEIANDNGWTVSPRVDLSYIWAFGDTNSNMEVKSPFAGVSQLGYDVMDDGSFLGLVGIEAHKGQWGYGIAYSYQKGDHSESKKWYVDVNYSF